MRRTLRIGTRGSPLALAQSRWVQSALHALRADLQTELRTIKTTGDRAVEQPLSQIGGKGVFVKEIEDALLTGTIDCAVHSMKDVPGELARGLVIAAVPQREDARDALVARQPTTLDRLPHGARIGTGSLRRMAALRAARRDLQVLPLRGNVDTRLRKLDEGHVDAVVLAAAGLRRLGIERAGIELFDPEQFIPAIGQGALAVESRDDPVRELLAGIDHSESRIAVTAERAFLLRVGGSCHTPLAAHAIIRDGKLVVRAFIASPDGTHFVRGARTGSVADAVQLGRDLGAELLASGGAAILQGLGETAHAG